jgi:uncharacterized cupin superfamily protein
LAHDDTRSAQILNHESLDWTRESSADGSAVFFRKKLGATTGARALGCTINRIPAGQGSWPCHYHTANEEAVYVLQGSGRLRVGNREFPIAAGDYAALPVGEQSAHQIANDSDEDLVFLCLSTMVEPDVVVYPDSGKVGVFVGTAPGGPPEDSKLKKFFPADANVDYWEGE